MTPLPPLRLSRKNHDRNSRNGTNGRNAERRNGTAALLIGLGLGLAGIVEMIIRSWR